MHAIRGTKRPKTAALILAGGAGTRLGADRPKQHLKILGKSVVLRTLLAFEECPYIDEIVIACRDDDIETYRELARENKLTKIKAITVGGADRQQSAHRAFLKISDDTRYVAVHDAARCLITPEQITRVAVEAFSCGAAIAACKAKDTVKLVENDRIKETPDRETVWQAQTPQIMKTDLYRACIYTALEDGFVGTDDASLCERHGFEVRVVDTGYENIKITTPIDLLIAESVIRQRESEENAK